MKFITLFCLICSTCLFCSSSVAQGKLTFYVQDTTKPENPFFEGSTAEFVCQNNDLTAFYEVKWTFQNATFFQGLTENGKINSGVDSAKYRLRDSSTALEVVDLAISDSGNYTCSLTQKNGQILLSATAGLNVKARPTNASAQRQLTPHRSYSAVPYNLQPSPTQSLPLSALTDSTTLPLRTAVMSSAFVTRQPYSALCENSSSITDVSFIKEETSTNLVILTEGGRLALHCGYCLMAPGPANLSWYKERDKITDNTYQIGHSSSLTLPEVRQRRDEGLYECVVETGSRNISTLFTVIIEKTDSNPLLSSIFAVNTSLRSVRITWKLTEHGLFIVTHVQIKLRPLYTSTWTHQVDDMSPRKDSFVFDQLYPATEYVLNVSLFNNNNWMDSKTVVLWSAASNSSDFEDTTKLLYQVTNRRALGVALGIIGFLAALVLGYACLMWCQDDKRGYSVPPGQGRNRDLEKHGENEELTTKTNLYYNRAFLDDDSTWTEDQYLVS